MSDAENMHSVVVRPLTAEAFAPFGQVVQMDEGSRRNRLTGAFERTEEAVEPRLWVATVNNTVTLPLLLSALERHPYSAQSFLPINVPYIVVVCQPDAVGKPDLDTLQAFSATAQQGVTYARNVWHHGLTVLEAPARFVVSMSFTATSGDDVFVQLNRPVQLVFPGA